MLKYVLSGTVMVASLGLAIEPASAITPVMAQCPAATWTVGYNLWELIPLAESQYKSAIVTDPFTPIRAGMGFESTVLFNAEVGTQVTVIGEAWDTGCNQWMYVRINEGLHWVHGDRLRLL
ncbi:MAG: hypothetical protein F6K42_19770 [Leptolyngbya sp. SIO1D8]|nr:hypothetical protein [Leptolyngbya sp. SIO1D8]